MATKQSGKCPFCGEIVTAKVIEENTIRRDRCQCPSCNETIYVCRVPGCHDYAKGTSIYDHELCPDCTSKLENTASTVGKSALEVAKTIVAAVLLDKLGLKGVGKRK